MPEWLCDIIAKLHAKKPEERFQSAKELSELLEQHLAHLQHPSQVPLPPTVARIAKVEDSGKLGASVRPALGRWVKTAIALMALALISVVTVHCF
jgi:hypothetical protein